MKRLSPTVAVVAATTFIAGNLTGANLVATTTTVHLSPGSQITVIADTPAPTITPTPSVGPKFPADTILAALPTPPDPSPAVGSSIIEGASRITHISTARQAYSRISAWNRDGTRLLLGFAYPGRMLDGATYADLGAFSQVSEARWSNVDPAKLYGVRGNDLVTQNLTGAVTTLHTFPEAITIGPYEGGLSDDDSLIVLSGTAHLYAFNPLTNTVVGTIPVPAGLDNAQPSRKGTYVVVVGSFGTRAYTRDLSSYRQLTTTGNHGDNALDAAGREIYVGCNANEFGGTQVIAFDLATGTRTVLLSGSAYEYGHVSGRALDRPGWVYLSNYDTVKTAGRAGRDQVIAVKTDGSGTVQVFGFSHHGGDDGTAAAYQRQPQAVPSPDGRRVLFASEWGGTVGSAYIAEAA